MDDLIDKDFPGVAFLNDAGDVLEAGLAGVLEDAVSGAKNSPC